MNQYSTKNALNNAELYYMLHVCGASDQHTKTYSVLKRINNRMILTTDG